jgi:protein involved in polysaccharide export with SLBB domain
MQGFVNEIRSQKPVGRLSVIADPSMLAVRPDRDLLLEPGDSIYIPPRPSSVTVLGAVMQPGSYLFNPDDSVDDYISLAGGYGRYALSDTTFVVYPDGTADSVDRSWLKFNRQAIPPGSVIYVPRDVFPTQWLPLTISISEILKDFAISAASLAVLAKAN